MPPKTAKKSSRKSPHVPGQALGFLMQETRLLARALEAEEGSFVSLEVLDDIGVQSKVGKVKVEQNKSITSAKNPVSDRSVEMWKTFANWVTAVQDSEINPDKTEFVLYVSTPVSGSLVELFHSADTIQGARQAIAKARDQLWGKGPTFSERKSVASGLAPFLGITLGNEELFSKVIKNFKFEKGSGSPIGDLRTSVVKMSPPEHIEEVLTHSLGIVKKQVELLLEKKRPAIISVDDIRSQIHGFIRAKDRKLILESCAPAPTSLQVDQERNTRTYVKQLELVNAEEDVIIHAINDYLSATVDRVEWGKRGHVMDTSFDEFEKTLIRAWTQLRTVCEIEHSAKTPEERGRLLHAKCSLHQVKLQAAEVPSHFVPGSYHKLSDESEVGWHPKFSDKFPKRKKGQK